MSGLESVSNRLPYWFRQEIPDGKALGMARFLSEFGIHTVCHEAKCPNTTLCFKKKHVTFLILGNKCTRNCKFCNVKKTEPDAINEDEPLQISRSVKILGLNYIVITSVTRDDLSDGGAAMFALAIKLIREANSNARVEVLIPDFQGKALSIKCVLDSGPFAVAHNMETVERLYSDLRPMANYQRSLGVLKKIKELNNGMITKSSLMLGLGETEKEIVDTMQDLRDNYCEVLTMGQYLAPSINHYPVKEFIEPRQFQKYREIALGLGFKAVLSGPLARSSYMAQELQREISLCTT